MHENYHTVRQHWKNKGNCTFKGSSVPVMTSREIKVYDVKKYMSQMYGKHGTT